MSKGIEFSLRPYLNME